ncbi:hypothetical protein SISSUDRAFT_1046406 [Sistotremastrum suecicum HHB10207 ss-3]|uniref:Uncharacterized protein n=1 Tax=Sistotremastrum suecicum HHB10207 ss-3 TaxID=1314776 RepID=A0A166DR80_9AGAM|nr:hypothetical protein SISSUDRAFT_1046406 [Sistotremastrum suecicum HHB10207 ss-3]
MFSKPRTRYDNLEVRCLPFTSILSSAFSFFSIISCASVAQINVPGSRAESLVRDLTEVIIMVSNTGQTTAFDLGQSSHTVIEELLRCVVCSESSSSFPLCSK